MAAEQPAHPRTIADVPRAGEKLIIIWAYRDGYKQGWIDATRRRNPMTDITVHIEPIKVDPDDIILIRDKDGRLEDELDAVLDAARAAFPGHLISVVPDDLDLQPIDLEELRQLLAAHRLDLDL